MITKTNAVKMSTRKWEALSQGKRPQGYRCGFCEFFIDRRENTHNKLCQKCPLYPDVCKDYDVDSSSLFHQYIKHNGYNRDIAKQILDAIIKRGADWIKDNG